MSYDSPIESLAEAFYTAISNPEILPDIEHAFRGESRKARPTSRDVKVYHFKQMWGSTALGFGGMGGAAMTNAYTTVIVSGLNAAVFFAGRHAYSIDNFDESFREDLSKHSMPSVSKAMDRYK